MKISDEDLKGIILKSGFVTEDELKSAAKLASDLDRPLSDVLIERGIILEKFLGQAISDHLKFPYADLKSHFIESGILNLISEEDATSKRAIPFKKEDGKVHLAMEDPTDLATEEFIKKKTHLDVIPYFILPSVLDEALDQYHKDVKRDFEKIIVENIQEAKVGGKVNAQDLPIVKILDTLLEYAASERASDLHIDGIGDTVIIRFRVDGRLRDVLELPPSIQAGLVTRVKILSSLRTDEHRIPQDGRFRFKHRDDEISVRVSILPTYQGEDVSLRLLSAQARPKTLEDLGLTGRNLEVVKEEIKKPHGMVLSTGPTGCGKTTTLYNILNLLNSADVNICTIEDPIEYGLRRVNQTQVNPAAGLTFAAGLRSILRHDPNIILVGEIRDKETAEIAIHAALTGHLVLSSLHTNDAIGAIPRLYDLGAQPYLIGSTLNLVIAKRLVARNCPNCLVRITLDPSLLKTLKAQFGQKLPSSLKKDKFYYHKGKGCDNCGGSGFKGRIGIFEVLKISEDIKEKVFNKASIQDILALAEKEGFKTMLEDGIEKVEAGQTTIEEIVQAVRE